MKKALSIVALCLIGILAGVIIAFSCINKDFNLKLTNPDFVEIYVNTTTTSQSYGKNGDSEHKAVYDKVMNLYNQSFKQKLMSSLFNGTLSEKATITREYKNNIAQITNSGVWVVFNYENEQVLMLNGKEFAYTENGYNDTHITYNRLYVEVKDSSTMTTFNIYVRKSGSESSYYRYTARAKQADLYKYLKENFAL